MSYLDRLKCHALTQGCTIDWVTDYTIETFIFACHPLKKGIRAPFTTCCYPLYNRTEQLNARQHKDEYT